MIVFDSKFTEVIHFDIEGCVPQHDRVENRVLCSPIPRSLTISSTPTHKLGCTLPPLKLVPFYPYR